MTFIEWLKLKEEENYRKYGLETQAAVASELAKGGNKPNAAAIARNVVNNPKVKMAASRLPGLKPDEMQLTNQINKNLIQQQQQAKLQQTGQQNIQRMV